MAQCAFSLLTRACLLLAPLLCGLPPTEMLESRACNAISWSPQGRIIVLAGLKNFNGQLEFFNVRAWGGGGLE